MDIIVRQIVILVILGSLGYIFVRTGYLPQNTGQYLSRLVIRVTAPALLITNMASYEFTLQTLKDGFWIVIIFCAISLLGFPVGAIFARIFKLEGATANIFKTHCITGNVGYLAVPLLNNIYGSKGLIYANFSGITTELLIWTVGIYLVNRHSNKSAKDNLKHLINPGIIAFLTGIFLSVINIKQIAENNIVVWEIYDIFYKTLNPLGNITLYLVMLFIGMSIAEAGEGGIVKILKNKHSYILSLYKLLVMPGIAFLATILAGAGLSSFAKTIVVLTLAMPCASVIPVLAAQYGSDYKFATNNVVISTILSMLTLPVVMYIVERLF
jgi:predicted permease